MSGKLVSVCMNVYNAEDYIVAAINSVINQTYKNLQIIIVDDDSTDNTLNLIKSIKDPRIEIYSQPYNCHISHACNTALKFAKGDYIAHLDSDDIWFPEKIEKQIEFLENNHEYGACFSYISTINTDGNVCDETNNYFTNLFTFNNIPQREMYRYLFDNSNMLCHSTAFIRRELVEKVGLYDASLIYLQDFDYWMRLLTVCPIYILPQKLMFYRVHNGNNSKVLRENSIAHDNEMVRVIYRSINCCPDKLFLEAFADKLHFDGEHTHEETEIEKALLLLNGTLTFKGNPILGIYKFAELFNDKNYIRLAKEKFGFSVRDFNQYQKYKSYYNAEDEKAILVALDEQKSICASLNKDIDNLSSEVSKLKEMIKQREDKIFEYENSFFWRLTAPARKLLTKIKTFVKRYRRILIMLIWLKGFLKGGFKGGKARVKSYYNFINYVPDTTEHKCAISDDERKFEKNFKFPREIKLSILVPIYNTQLDYLREMIASVKNQTYINWELCLADGSDNGNTDIESYCQLCCNEDQRIKYIKLGENKGISENTNECIKLASGDFIALFDHDDILHPSAVFEIVKRICETDADFVYTDEATFIDNVNNIVLYHFKPDFSPDTLRSYNYICHFSAFSRKLLDKVGGFREKCDGSQDYDMILRLTEKANNIEHISKILYYWRSHPNSVASSVTAKPYTIKAALTALTDHLERVGLEGEVCESNVPTTYKIKYQIKDTPLVSIVIPNMDHIDDLERCLSSIYTKSTYSNFEVIIVENNSKKSSTFKYYEVIKKRYKNLKVITWKREFNYSAINNFAVAQTDGEYIILLNNDVEIISNEWIEEMLMFAQRNDVGAVGAKLYYPNDTIQHAGVILGLGGVAGHSHKCYDSKDVGYAYRLCVAQNLSACTAACLMVNKNVFNEVDGLDEDFKVAFNDVDFCMKIRATGRLIVFTPYAELYHYESISRGAEDTPEKIQRFNSEIDLFKKKWNDQLIKGDPYYNPNLTLDREDFSLK